MDVIFNLINVKRFFKYTYEEQIQLKENGRPLPDLIIENPSVSRGKTYKRQFNKDIYLKNNWICGCNKKNALFCFPCVLYGGDKSWTEVGVTDLMHLNEKIKKHDSAKNHIYNCMEFAVLGTANILTQLDSAYWMEIQKHNEYVTKNRYVLSKIINCIKFCGAFELATKGHDESDSSENPGIFRGLINFSAELDTTLSEHIKNASTFQGTSKEIQNELLQCMLEVCHEEIINEINNASFVAMMVDEATDCTSQSQLVVIFRYIRNGEPVERFWNYLNLAKYNAETLSETILTVLDPLIENSPNKLIAQCYDGATIMSDQDTGVQALIKRKYPFAHFVHCYAHQLNLIMSKSASENSEVRVFFGSLPYIFNFFNNSPHHIEVLERIMTRKNAHGDITHWNFNVETLNVVYENRDSLIECMEEIEEQFFNETICSAASSIRRMLNDSVFIFWLTFFRHVMPHVDILFNQLQQRKIEPTQVKDAIDHFERSIIHITNIIDDIVNEASNLCPQEPEHKRKRPCDNIKFYHHSTALEMCDVIIKCVKDRFAFNDHLVVASLFDSEYFKEYCNQFPDLKIASACSVYPTIDKQRLRCELSVIYSRRDCRTLCNALPFLKFLTTNNLEDTLKETKKLLEIVVTTPMTTSEAGRCLSTLKRIETFLQNSITDDRLSALSMLSVEKKFITEIDHFNEKVIEKFVKGKDGRMALMYKR